LKQITQTVDGRNSANQLMLVVHPIFASVSYIQKAVFWDFFHQQHHTPNPYFTMTVLGEPHGTTPSETTTTTITTWPTLRA